MIVNFARTEAENNQANSQLSALLMRMGGAAAHQIDLYGLPSGLEHPKLITLCVILQEVAINDNFAKMTEALYVAEQSARQAVEMRSRVQRELAAKEKEKKDRELRELAIKARMDRLGGSGAAPGAPNPSLAAREAGAVLPPPLSGGSRHMDVEVRSLCMPSAACF